jgi:hypothetical protein
MNMPEVVSTVRFLEDVTAADKGMARVHTVLSGYVKMPSGAGDGRFRLRLPGTAVSVKAALGVPVEQNEEDLVLEGWEIQDLGPKAKEDDGYYTRFILDMPKDGVVPRVERVATPRMFKLGSSEVSYIAMREASRISVDDLSPTQKASLTRWDTTKPEAATGGGGGEEPVKAAMNALKRRR